jgi:hypothetical protein
LNITVPSSEIDNGHFWQEPPPNTEEFWAFIWPVRAKVGDPIYFNLDRKPIAEAVISRIEKPGESQCAETDRFLNRWKVFWTQESFKKVGPKTANQSSSYPKALVDADAIATYIMQTSPGYVNEEMIREYLSGAHATLQQLPISELEEGHPDVNTRSLAKERRYKKLDPDTIPPIVVLRGKVIDGNHRLRVVKEMGLTKVWCYVAEFVDFDHDSSSNKEAPGPKTANAPLKTLVIVHPGSCCGSANDHYGSRSTANAVRDGLVYEWNSWQGGVIVIDGELSDELPDYPELNSALSGILARAKQNGLISIRRFGHDPDQVSVIKTLLKKLNLPTGAVHFDVTGAWYYNDTEGCVTSVYDAITSLGYKATISDYALTGQWGPNEEDWEEEEDDSQLAGSKTASINHDSKTLYHGTCREYADILLKSGFVPGQVSAGGNQGQSRYLYLTNEPENARWFAEEKGCDVVLIVQDIPANLLRVDPEDGIGATVEEELSNQHGLPGSVVLKGTLPASHFSELGQRRQASGTKRSKLLESKSTKPIQSEV